MSNIAVWELRAPILFVFNTSSLSYALVDVIDEKNRMLDINIDEILNNTKQTKYEVNIKKNCLLANNEFKMFWLSFIGHIVFGGLCTDHFGKSIV